MRGRSLTPASDFRASASPFWGRVGTQVLAHADLLGEHVLVDHRSGALAGIVDWGDAFTTLRSIDFAGLFFEFGRGLTAKAYSAYGVTPDEHEWRWLEQRAVAIGIEHVFYGTAAIDRDSWRRGWPGFAIASAERALRPQRWSLVS